MAKTPKCPQELLYTVIYYFLYKHMGYTKSFFFFLLYLYGLKNNKKILRQSDLCDRILAFG